MIGNVLRNSDNLSEYELERFAKELAFNNGHFYLRENYYESKENNMYNEVCAVFDIFDENLNGDLRDHLIGICSSVSEARSQIEKMNLDNFRWLGNARCKFSRDGKAHVIVIDNYVMNEIFV